MSGEEEELSGAECDLRAAEFVAITGTDEACAHFFLQDCGWDLQDYTSGSGVSSFLLLTWNVDGMEPKGLETRMKAVCTIIIAEKPDVIHLQEVSPEAERIIGGYLGCDFDVHTSASRYDPEPYYTLSLARRSTVRIRSTALRHFPTSAMGRSMLILRTTIGEADVDFVNTHSESMAAHREERDSVSTFPPYSKAQERKSWEGFQQHEAVIAELNRAPANAIVAGDLNARDSDISKIPGVESTKDAWVERGSRKFTQYTWDGAKNDSIQGNGRYKPRCRFDRVLYRAAGAGKRIGAVDLRLAGTQRIKATQSFPSDHFGLLVSFALL